MMPTEYRHDLAEMDLAELERPGEHVRGPEDGMACERQLRERREDPDARVPAGLGGKNEDRFGEVHLLCEPLHRQVVEIAAVGEDRELIARQRRVREDIGNDVTKRAHAGSLRRRFR